MKRVFFSALMLALAVGVFAGCSKTTQDAGYTKNQEYNDRIFDLARERSDFVTLKNFMEEKNINPNVVNTIAREAILVEVAKTGNVEFFEYLLERGASAQTKDQHGTRVLYMLQPGGNLENEKMYEILLRYVK